MNVIKEQSESGFIKFGAMINWEELNDLIGQLLTYVDATYADVEQRKAHKSLVKNLVRDWYNSCERSLPVKMRYDSDGSSNVAMPLYFPWNIELDGVRLPNQVR